MAFIQDLTSLGYDHNRVAPSDSLTDFDHNRAEVIPPAITDQIVQVAQQIPDGAVTSTKLTVHDVGNAGISNIGAQTSDIRIWAGATFANRATAPFRVDQAGNLFSSSATLSGSITATGGTFGGWTLSATTITSATGNIILDSAGNIRFGKTGFSDTTNAGLIMGLNGATPTFYLGTAADASYMKLSGGVYDLVGTVSSRSTLTISTAINASGNLITDVINGRLDSSAKTILAGFNFGSSDYAGAVNAGNVTWNTTTGSVTGGSGIVVYRKGIVGVASGVTTFSIDSTTGAATFGGNLSAPTGNIGGWTINSSTLTAGNTTIDSAGKISLGTGNNIIILDANDATYRLAIGNATYSSAPFRVDKTGAMTATNATITGDITANTGKIGGSTNYWAIAAGDLNATGSGDVAIRAGQTDYNTGTGFWLGRKSGTAKFSIGDGGVSQYLTWDGTNLVVNGRAFSADPTFGDGSDGNTTLGAGTTTLSRDMFYDQLTVPNGATLDASGYRIFCKTSATLSGTGIISRDGNAGSNATAGSGTTGGTGGTGASALADGSIKGSVAGITGANGGAGGTQSVNGSNGSNGTAGNSITGALGVAGTTSTSSGTGGAGGGPIGAGSSGSTASGGSATGAIASVRNVANAILMLDSGATSYTRYTSSASSGGAPGAGGGGGGNGSGSGSGGGGGGGGGGGSPGGLVFLAAKTITIGASAKITALGGGGGTGGNGAVGSNGSSNNGGGGGGAGAGGSAGAGGVIVLIYTTLSNSGSISVAAGTPGSAGTPGNGGTHGASGSNGTNGGSGNTGASGTSGTIIQLQLS